MNIDQTLAQMTLDEKIGQLFLLAFSGDRLDEARILMEEHMVGAAYISNDNIPDPERAARLTETLQGFAHNTRLQIPLLLGVDQEGAWSVMSPFSTTGPGNMALGATRKPQHAYEMYHVIGQELRAVGLNTLLAPCADCNSNPRNTIIGMRAFGEFPELVGEMTAAAVRGAQDAGVLATIKHFPGHGDTHLDSHRGLPTVSRNRDELKRIDLYPFQKGIDAGVDIVMTAHILFAGLDPEYPATLSTKILQDLLRREMGFQGVILSDSMNMGAMKRHYDPHKATIQAIQAGVDLIMLAEEHYDHDEANYLANQRALIQAVKHAVEDGELSAARVDDAVQRVLQIKAKYLSERGMSKPEPDLVGSAANRAIELNAARAAVAVLSDTHHLLPLAADQPIVLVNTTARENYAALVATRGIGPNQQIAAFDHFTEHLRRQNNNVVMLSAEDFLRDPEMEIPEGHIVLAVTENYPLPGMDFDQSTQVSIIQKLVERVAGRLIVVALRDPYELANLPALPTYVCAFSFRPCSAQAAVDVLFGACESSGTLPVSV